MQISTAHLLTLYRPFLPPQKETPISHNCFHTSSVSRGQEFLRNTETEGLLPVVTETSFSLLNRLFGPAPHETEVQTISFLQVMIISAYVGLEGCLPNLF